VLDLSPVISTEDKKIKSKNGGIILKVLFLFLNIVNIYPAMINKKPDKYDPAIGSSLKKLITRRPKSCSPDPNPKIFVPMYLSK
tara:strand:- start:280 stop:531 length:252 start_codon:yes stop_codon:yes gene_type:complete